MVAIEEIEDENVVVPAVDTKNQKQPQQQPNDDDDDDDDNNNNNNVMIDEEPEKTRDDREQVTLRTEDHDRATGREIVEADRAVEVVRGHHLATRSANLHGSRVITMKKFFMAHAISCQASFHPLH